MTSLRVFTTEQVFRELRLDEDSASEDDSASNSSDFVPELMDSSDEVAEEEVDDRPGPSRPATSSSRSTTGGRRRASLSSTRARGRGRRQTRTVDEDDNDEGWVQIEYGDFSQIPSFTGEAGVKVDIPGDKTPKDFFELFLDSRMIDVFVVETNRYAQQAAQAAPDFYYLKGWKPTHAGEMNS